MLESYDLQKIDMGFTMAVCALITAMGMQAENQKRLDEGKSIAYGEEAFQQILSDNGLSYNAVILRWRD